MKLSNIKKILPTSLIYLSLTGCSTSSLGYLPGADYEVYKSQKQINLQGKVYKIEIIDNRVGKNKVQCWPNPIDRSTELEGAVGLSLIKSYVEKSIINANGKISETNGIPLQVKLNGSSFILYDFLNITAIGLNEIDVVYNNKNKVYCAHASDKDDDAPLKWYSVDTRIGAARKLSSHAVRLNIDKVLQDIESDK